jgi:hypothetical protein
MNDAWSLGPFQQRSNSSEALAVKLQILTGIPVRKFAHGRVSQSHLMDWGHFMGNEWKVGQRKGFITLPN